nr:hypothetical protein BAR15_180004 [Bartonella sp. AR 15-3]
MSLLWSRQSVWHASQLPIIHGFTRCFILEIRLLCSLGRLLSCGRPRFFSLSYFINQNGMLSLRVVL